MKTAARIAAWLVAGAILVAPSSVSASHADWQLGKLAPIARIDRRFQSYNVEMVEVTGGRFWAPYGGPADEVYRMRRPIDLANLRLRQLARLLAPAYLRVSGTWANTTYLPAAGETVGAPPTGFAQVLQRDQWRGVVAFSQAVDAPIVTSFAVSSGTRDASGRWQPAQAQRLNDLTQEAGGTIAAAEFFNEPNLTSLADLPKGYSVAAYLRDFAVFHRWARQAAPDMRILGHSGLGSDAGDSEIPAASLGTLGRDSSAALIAGTAGQIDVVSYHFYGGVSPRCAFLKIGTVQKDEALSSAWLDKTLSDYGYFARLRDRYEPGKPIWLSETAQAACGGSPWASTFRDSFRYLNQLGVLAQRGVQVVMHNTLAASDYALLEPETLEPRPNFWAAVLWRRTMGEIVLASPTVQPEGVRVFAHCLRGSRGGVALLALNTGNTPVRLPTGLSGKAWIMRASPLDSKTVTINGAAPTVDPKGRVQGLAPQKLGGQLNVPAQSVAFAALPQAGNPACR